MSTPTTPDNQGATPVASPASGQTVAEDFIARELVKTRAAIKQTQIVGIIILIVITSYMSYVTLGLKEKFSPHTAATIANGIIAERVTDKASEVADQLKHKIPELISQVPDYVLKQLPEYRMALENHVEADFSQYCQATSKDLAKHLDDFLATHKNEIKEMLAHAEDRETLKQLAPDLEKEIVAYLEEKPEEGESIKQKIDGSLEVLDKIARQTERLASANDLTPQEKKTRRAIAIIAKKIDQQVN